MFKKNGKRISHVTDNNKISEEIKNKFHNIRNKYTSINQHKKQKSTTASKKNTNIPISFVYKMELQNALVEVL